MTEVVLFEGVIDDHDVDLDHPAKAYTARCLDAWGRPAGEKLSTPLYRGIRTGDAIGLVLDAAGWTGGRDIDPGTTAMPWWWAEDDDAASAIEKLVDSEGPPAIAYVWGGVFVFRDRLHRLTRTASQTSQADFTNVILPAGSGPVGAFKIEEGSFRHDQGQKHIVNAVSFTVEERRAVDPGMVWETDDPVVVPASSSTVLHVQTSDPFYDAIVPATGIDYVVESGSAPTVTLSRTSGRSLVINLAGGGSQAVIRGMRLRATSVPVARSVKVTAEDAGSITDNQGRRTWGRDVPFANAYDAQAIADRIIATWADARPRIVFTIAAMYWDPATREQVLERAISDRVTVRDDDTGTDADFVIERVEHRIRKLGMVHRLTLWCQQADPAGAPNFFTFGVSGKGFTDGVFA
jgi:hypothetical protein